MHASKVVGIHVCRNGKLSTRAEVLQELQLQHPLPGIILEHRKLTKLLTGFLEQLMDKAVKASGAAAAARSGGGAAAAGGEGHTGMQNGGSRLCRIRGEFMQTNTATGRLSMEEPSLQTIPKPVQFEIQATITSQSNADAHADNTVKTLVETSNMRAAFVAPEGFVLLSADYCQLELRLMAHFSGGEQLVATLGSQGQDPFKLIAAKWLKCAAHQVRGQPDCLTAPCARDASRKLRFLLCGCAACVSAEMCCLFEC